MVYEILVFTIYRIMWTKNSTKTNIRVNFLRIRMHHVIPNNKDQRNGSKEQTRRIVKNIVHQEIQIKNDGFKEQIGRAHV